eukprot:6153597-Karenia_brevis.AAC.1
MYFWGRHDLWPRLSNIWIEAWTTLQPALPPQHVVVNEATVRARPLIVSPVSPSSWLRPAASSSSTPCHRRLRTVMGFKQIAGRCK